MFLSHLCTQVHSYRPSNINHVSNYFITLYLRPKMYMYGYLMGRIRLTLQEWGL